MPKPFDIAGGIWCYDVGKGVATQSTGKDNNLIGHSSAVYKYGAPFQQEGAVVNFCIRY